MTYDPTHRRIMPGVPPCAEALDAALLVCIVRYFEGHRRAPSWDTMCRATGLSSKESVHRRLVELRDAGLVTWERGKDGTLRPTVALLPVGP